MGAKRREGGKKNHSFCSAPSELCLQRYMISRTEQEPQGPEVLETVILDSF